MRGEKTLEFPFAIRFSENGSFAESSRITLRAPGLGKRHVHNQMVGYIMEAYAGASARRGMIDQLAEADAKKGVKVATDDDQEQSAKDEPEDPTGFLKMLAIGLGHDKYAGFCDYIIAQLTGSPKLATVGDNGTALTEDAWESIADQGGMAEVDRVVGTFASFFVEDRASPSKNGAGTSRSSSSPTKAVSPTNTPRASRLKS